MKTTKASLCKEAKIIAEDNFDDQTLKLLDVIKDQVTFHHQHKTTLINYVEADRLRGIKNDEHS